MALKTANPGLRVHLAVGGWNMGTAPFQAITASEPVTRSFAENAISFLRQHGFDGLDLDWEYPGESHKTKFTTLCRILYQKFLEESQSTGKPRLLLTAAVAAYKNEVEKSYEPQLISQYLDHISVMAYDYFGSWSSVIGHNSALYSP